MALGYTYQSTFVILGTRSGSTITTEELESTYAVAAAGATYVFETGGMSKVNFNFRYTMGATETTNSIEIRIRTSPSGDVYHQIPNEAVSGATSTLTRREFTYVGVNAATSDLSLPLDIQDEYMEFAAKETGVVTNKGGVFVEMTLSGAK